MGEEVGIVEGMMERVRSERIGRVNRKCCKALCTVASTNYIHSFSFLSSVNIAVFAFSF